MMSIIGAAACCLAMFAFPIAATLPWLHRQHR